jgi:predicted phosphatase
LLGISHTDPNIGKLRHVARMLTRLSLTASELHSAEQLLLNLSWQQRDAALQVLALKSLGHFARTNFRLREYAGPFVYDLMRRVRNGRVMREAEITLNTIEYFDEQTHDQWDRLQAHA